ncbi:hypothetical protein MORY_04783 [Mycobacterium orygis 112400015]|uniref:ER-bound oxygenase mpaB/mpaB'/Rubber oxygenase catalytic domain-containing protein n=1 Tax=Mycobacterium orygis 112400015 TaxID=1305739 RepID=A0A829C7A6_9MYCO|nr:hypothetical protein MORY_04783 [Mycobacterium orygis 112400015]
MSPLGYESPPLPLGPDSLTWRYFGDWRGMLQGPWAGSMQNMHPQLGAAVEDHSTFFRERWPRLLRSLYPIGGVSSTAIEPQSPVCRCVTTTSPSRVSTVRAVATTR